MLYHQAYILFDRQSGVLLGISHVVLNGWGVASAALGFRGTLGLSLSPLGVGVGLPRRWGSCGRRCSARPGRPGIFEEAS